MMEGGVNPKKMARSKRASSQRSKAKHSKHGGHGGVVSAVPREKAVSEDLLPSNWERYGDESGSDEDLAPLAEGEVRPKSKGADYRELLSSDVPQLFEESPEMEGMTAMLLANGLGLWDWDSSYLEPASLSSERQVAREASALLTVDMRLLGKSLARLNLAQRLFLEDELFPKQKQVGHGIEMTDTSTRVLDSEGASTPMKDGLVHEQHDLSEDTSFRSGSSQSNAEFPLSASPSDTSSNNRSVSHQVGERVSKASEDTSSVAILGTTTPPVNSGDLVTNSASISRSAGKHTIDMKEKRWVQNPREPTDVKSFEAKTAEADLDDLLDLLDNQVAAVSLKNVNQVNHPRRFTSETVSFSPAPSYSASSRPSSIGFQEPRIDHKSTVMIPEPVLRENPKHTGTPSHSTPKAEKTNPSSGAKGADVSVSQDDDFDSWLDSI